MSIATEITRLQNAKSALKTAINAKNDAQHQIASETLEDYATFVGDIQTGTDVSDTTATAGDVLSGKDFYLADGSKTTGTIATYTGSTSRTSNGTFSTANKYLTSNLTVSVDGAGQIYRHLNPTIIRLNLTNASANTSITIKIKQFSSGGRAFTMNWGDGTQDTISTSTSTQTKTHTYSLQGVYSIVFSPTNQSDNRFTLTNTDESADMLVFDEYMFGQSSNSPFGYPVSIYCGDSTWFASNSLSYCTYIEVLSFENMSSLLEQTTPNQKYFTQDYLAEEMCKNSTIWTLILGNSVSELKGACFNGCTVWDMIIIDARGTGKSTAPITVASSTTLPTIVNKIHVNHLRLNSYQGASYWSAKSSQMIGY